MSLLRKDTIKIIAESVGIKDLSDEISQLLVYDIEYRLREVTQEAMKFSMHSKRNSLTTQDVNNALRMRNVERLYGYSSSKSPLKFRRVVGNSGLFYLEDEEILLDSLISAPLPEIPHDVTFSAHWLAVEGVQPKTRHNPSPSFVDTTMPNLDELSRVQVFKQVTKHNLSKELQLYYEKIIQSLLSNDPILQEAAFNSLREDPGINQLLPYFSQWISDQVTNNIRLLPRLHAVLHTINSFLDSTHLNLQPYLHQLIPAIVTCMVSARISQSPEEDHWSVRQFAAKLITTITEKFGSTYTSIKPRISKVLLDSFLDLSKPLTTHFGAVIGLTCFGVNTIGGLLIPNLVPYVKYLTPELSSSNFIRQGEAQHTFGALLEAARIFLTESLNGIPDQLVCKIKSHSMSEQENHDLDQSLNLLMPFSESYSILFDVFGEKIYPFLPTASSSSSSSSSSSFPEEDQMAIL